MAVTSKKSKARLDYGEALNDALFYKNIEPETAQMKEPDNVIGRIDFNTNQEATNINHEQQMEQSLSTDGRVTKLLEYGLDDADMFLAIAKSPRGVQRSIYFESDIYQYLQTKAEKYNVKFSNLVNMLLREAILNHTKSKG